MTHRLAFGLAVVMLASACGRGGPRPATAPPAQPGAAQPPVAVTPTPDTTRAPGDTLRPAPVVVQPPVILPPPPPAATDSAARAPARPPRPAQRCVLDLENTPDTRLLIVTDPISLKRTTFFGAGVVGVCRGQNIRITADSAESYEQNRLHFLIGNVKYRENKVSLDSDRLTYFAAEERILAEGNVVAVMQDSSSLVGPRAEYLRAVAGIRVASRMIATGRPTLLMYETDSTGKRQADPVTLIADNIYGEGESLFVAQGRVELDRTDLEARGDSAMLDNARQFARLMKEPQVQSKGTQAFTLRGKVIDVFGRSRLLERVLAKDSASAVNQDLTLTADTVDLRVTGNRLQSAYAFGDPVELARAVTRERTIVAESLHVSMPDQRMRELHAVGQAYAESDPDTTRVSTGERDWLRGDTIVALFDTAAVRDTAAQRDSTRQPPLRELTAQGSASSFYQIPSDKGGKDRPGLNYVRGAAIRIAFSAREVQTVTVDKQAAGLFLEPATDSTAARPPAPPPRRPPT